MAKRSYQENEGRVGRNALTWLETKINVVQRGHDGIRKNLTKIEC